MRKAIKVAYPKILERKRHTKTEITSQCPLGTWGLGPRQSLRETTGSGVLGGNHEQLRKRYNAKNAPGRRRGRPASPEHAMVVLGDFPGTPTYVDIRLSCNKRTFALIRSEQ